jgi:hypothetical protein
MRPTLLLRAGHYTPKIQFMGSKWKEAKSEFRLYCPNAIPFSRGSEKMVQDPYTVIAVKSS